MEFLGVGYQEILVILVLTLVVVGPERLPKVAYQIGRAVRTMQSYARVVRDEFSDEMKYFDEEVTSLRTEVESTRSSLRETENEFKQQQASFEKDVRATTKTVDDATKSVNQSVKTEERRSNVVPLPSREKPATNGAGPSAANGSRAEPSEEPPAPPLVF